MTKPELTNSRWQEQFFSGWIRSELPDSKTGFMVSDVDFILYNYKTKKVMLLEIKSKGNKVQTWQKNMFKNLNRWMDRGVDLDWKYLGFHLLEFENTNFYDGKVLYDHSEITEDTLREILSF